MRAEKQLPQEEEPQFTELDEETNLLNPHIDISSARFHEPFGDPQNHKVNPYLSIL